MPPRLRPIAHEDRLSLVDHLDELRKRLIVSAIAFSIAFAVCFWQNNAILELLDAPLAAAQTQKGDAKKPFDDSAAWQRDQRAAWLALAAAYRAQASSAAADDETARVRRLLSDAATAMDRAAATAPTAATRRPVTLGVGEPFVVTLKVAGYGALLLSLPIILFQLYAFVLPAFSKRERQVALPLMLAIPFLFIAGAVFAYMLVLPRAIDFLQNFNADNFDIQLQASDFYRFSILLLMVMGLLFQIPVGILAATRMGVVSVAQLRKHRRYALLVVAVLAMLLPGTDPITMLLAMLPLVLLYEGSIIFAAVLDRRGARERERVAKEEADEDARRAIRERAEADAEARAAAESDLAGVAVHDDFTPYEPDKDR